MQPSVLIVCDDKQTKMLLEQTFKSHGYLVLSRSSVDAAITALNVIHPDMVVVDLAVNSGIALCNAIKADHLSVSIPVVFLSGCAHGQIRNRCMESGADLFITKPFTGSDLVWQIENTFDTSLVEHMNLVH